MRQRPEMRAQEVIYLAWSMSSELQDYGISMLRLPCLLQPG